MHLKDRENEAIRQLKDLFQKLKLERSDDAQLLEQIKKQFFYLLKTLRSKPSYLTRAAGVWGNIALWQKILLGLVLTGTPLLAACVLHVGILFFIFALSLGFYSMTAFLLDNHARSATMSMENIQRGINGFIDYFGALTTGLKQLTQKLQEPIKVLEQENKNLQSLNQKHSGELARLMSKQKNFAESAKSIEHIAQAMQESATVLQNNLEQAQVRELQLEKLSQSYQSLLVELKSFTSLHESLEEEQKHKDLSIDALNGTLKQLNQQMQNKLSDASQPEYPELLVEYLETQNKSMESARDEIAELKAGLKQRQIETEGFMRQCFFKSSVEPMVQDSPQAPGPSAVPGL